MWGAGGGRKATILFADIGARDVCKGGEGEKIIAEIDRRPSPPIATPNTSALPPTSRPCAARQRGASFGLAALIFLFSHVC
jgi:hypothetical protein